MKVRNESASVYFCSLFKIERPKLWAWLVPFKFCDCLACVPTLFIQNDGLSYLLELQIFPHNNYILLNSPKNWSLHGWMLSLSAVVTHLRSWSIVRTKHCTWKCIYNRCLNLTLSPNATKLYRRFDLRNVDIENVTYKTGKKFFTIRICWIHILFTLKGDTRMLLSQCRAVNCTWCVSCQHGLH